MSEPRLEFATSVFPYSRFGDIREAVDVVVAAEALGFDAVMLPEHLLPPRWPDADISTKYWLDVSVLAAHLAAATKRLKFISGVIVVPYHHPVALAKALATADVLSGGRMMAGVGAGWMRAEFRRLGIPFQLRGAITDEYLAAMKQLWTSDDPKFTGKHIAFDDVSFFPRPVQPGGVPLLIGGSGPRPFRRLAALGDGWLPMTAGPDEIRAGLAEIGRLMTDGGRDPSSLWVGAGVSLGHDADTARMRAHVGTEGGEVELASSPAKSPGVAIAEIRALADAGATSVSLGVPWSNAKDLLVALEIIAREILPAFR